MEPLPFLGIIPNTPEVDSPTIWRDPENGDLLIQSYKASEEVRWLPRRLAADIALPGTDLWMFDESKVMFTYFSGDGDVVDREWRDEPEVIKLVQNAFETVWGRATPHQEYELK